MPTEAKVRDYLIELERGAPDVGAVLDSLTLDRPERSESRHRRTWAAGAAAAAVLVAAGLVAAGHEPDSARHPARSSAGATPAVPAAADLVPAWRFTVGAVRGYTVTRDEIIRTGPVTWVQQGAAVTAPSARVTGRLVVQLGSPGGYRSQLASSEQLAKGNGQAMTIDGRPGYFSAGSAVPPNGSGPWSAAQTAVESQPELIWQLPDGAWGMALGTFGFDASAYTYDNAVAAREMTRLAGAVHYVARERAVMPFRFRALPGGLVPESLRSYSRPAAQCLGYGTGAGPYPTGSVGSVVTACRVADLHGSAAPGALGSLLKSAKTLATRGLRDGTTLILLASPAHPDDLSPSQARRLVQYADSTPRFGEPSTWLPVG